MREQTTKVPTGGKTVKDAADRINEMLILLCLAVPFWFLFSYAQFVCLVENDSLNT